MRRAQLNSSPAARSGGSWRSPPITLGRASRTQSASVVPDLKPSNQSREDISNFPEAEDIVDHIATCSPCFLEYNAIRRRSRRRLFGGTALCCVVGLLLTGLILRWATPTRPQNETVAHQAPTTTIQAVLDFRNRTVNRSDREQTAREPSAPHLRRALLNLSINLPIGVEDGLYSVQFRNPFGQSVVNAVGTAAWDGSAETLVTAVDLRNLAPGEYILAVRQGNSAWREYAVILD